jgi:hypothetical protein
MRFTYVREDKIVGIDGEFLNIDNSSFDQEVDAIQWYETYGEIEFINRQERNNETFEDINYIQPLIDLWNITKSQPPVPVPDYQQQLLNKNQELTNTING